MSFEDFHIGKLKIGSWVIGIHFERVLQDIFKQRTTDGRILLQPAASKVADGLDQVLNAWATVEPIFDAAVSNEGQSSAEKAKQEVIQLRDDFRTIQTTDNIPQYLDEYTFAQDPKRNTFYHEFANILFTSFSDGKFSPIEFASIVSRLVTWIKEGN